MSTSKRPQLAALFAAALAAGAFVSVLLAVALAGPQPAHGQPASPLPTPAPMETGWEVISAPDSFFRLRLPPGWYASSGQNVVVIDNYNFHVIDQRPENGINIHISLGERPFLQTFEQYVAEWQKAESSPSVLGPYPTPIPIIPFQPITVGGYTGVSEVIKVAMENGEQWPIQSIILDVEPRWIAGITIKPISSPDYDLALRILGTLEIAPRCQEDSDLVLHGPKAQLQGELETVVARELEARQTANWPAFQSLVHSETDPARLALAHAAVQWEVEQATGRDHTLRLAAAAGPRSPLAVLLDPQRDLLAEDGTGDGAGNQGERDLFLRFAISERGRGVIAPYLQAVFHSESAEELVEAVFAEELPVVEKRWRAWLERTGAGS